MYKKLDEEAGTKERNDTSELIIKALKEKDVKLLAKNLYNMFETATKESTIIQKLKDILIENGAIGSLMTGSGSCVFGIFKNRETAKRAYMKLKDKYKTYICTSYNSKKEV